MRDEKGFFLIEVLTDSFILALLVGMLAFTQTASRQLEISQSRIAAQLLCQEYTDKMSIQYRTQGDSCENITGTKTLNGIQYGISAELIKSDGKRVHTKISWRINNKELKEEADRLVRKI